MRSRTSACPRGASLRGDTELGLSRGRTRGSEAAACAQGPRGAARFTASRLRAAAGLLLAGPEPRALPDAERAALCFALGFPGHLLLLGSGVGRSHLREDANWAPGAWDLDQLGLPSARGGAPPATRPAPAPSALLSLPPPRICSLARGKHLLRVLRVDLTRGAVHPEPPRAGGLGNPFRREGLPALGVLQPAGQGNAHQSAAQAGRPRPRGALSGAPSPGLTSAPCSRRVRSRLLPGG